MAVVQEVFVQLLSFMRSIVSTMMMPGMELLLIPVGIFVVGAAIGLASRLIGR